MAAIAGPPIVAKAAPTINTLVFGQLLIDQAKAEHCPNYRSTVPGVADEGSSSNFITGRSQEPVSA